MTTMLMSFTKKAFWQRPGEGPLIEPTSDQPKPAREKEVALEVPKWTKYLKQLNQDKKAYDKIVADDWGPTKGFNKNGKLIWIYAIYPGNVVQVDQLIDGYAHVVGLSTSAIPLSSLNWIDHPHLIHKVYGSNSKQTAVDLKHPAYVPNLCNGRWIDASLLWRIDVCNVEIIVGRFLNPIVPVCSDKTYKSKTNLHLSIGTKVTVTSVAIGEHGLWGAIAGGWIPLRYRGSQMTNWRI